MLQQSRQRKQKQNKAHKNKQQTKQQKIKQHGWWSAASVHTSGAMTIQMIALYHARDSVSWNNACACEQLGNHFKFVGTDL